MKNYKLDKNNQVVECSIEESTQYLVKNNIVKRTIINKILVSTIFLGVDHNFGIEEKQEPILFETMIFDIDENDKILHVLLDDFQERYTTYNEAIKRHEQIVALIKSGKLEYLEDELMRSDLKELKNEV